MYKCYTIASHTVFLPKIKKNYHFLIGKFFPNVFKIQRATPGTSARITYLCALLVYNLALFQMSCNLFGKCKTFCKMGRNGDKKHLLDRDL